VWDDQIRQLIEVKKTSHNKWLASKNLEANIEYESSTALTNQRREKKTQSLLGKYLLPIYNTGRMGLN
jgi:hypothetical protein